MLRLSSFLVLSLLLLPFAAGCGTEPMGQVHGKILFEGKPVPVGSVTFAPKAKTEDELESGRPATGTPNENGEFQLSTHKLNDGALVGTHIVTYTPPQPPETNNPEQRAREMKLFQQYGRCRLQPGYEFEVKPGRNDVTLEVKIQ